MRLSTTIQITDSELDYEHLIQHQGEFDAQQDHDVIVDLSRVNRITTSAFAQLICLRNSFAHAGHKLIIAGLQGQPQALYDMLKLRCLAMSS
ncbi:MAG: STAS domain-containing protein [Sedimentisphaerales bacterium]|nr:STAS domain-containing protein [Sedimentisphaerales bacterium]